ncbi:MAG: hypothetical protein ACRDY1_06350, partial [Acidimicrobiales bacterium]
MKRYSFALEAVLRVRRAQEEAAAFALAHANRQRQQAIEAGDRAAAACDAVVLGRAPQDHAGFCSERAVSERRTDAVVAARLSVARAGEEAAARHGDWTAAAR